MEINYVLYPNPITPNPDDCRAVIVNKSNYVTDQVIVQITGEGSILKPTECNAVIDAFHRQIGLNLAQGHGFSCEYFSVNIEIQGVFENNKDKLDLSRHTIYPNMMPGKPWKENAQTAKVIKLLAEENKPKLISIFDMKSKTTNQTLTPGSMAEIQGTALKLDETVPDEGVFIISENDGPEVKISYFFQNFPKNLLFEIPDSLTPGSYKIEVRNRAYNCKSLRTGLLTHSLSVS